MNPSEDRTLLSPSEFIDRVMTSIALAPTPTPTRAFVAAMRARALRDAAATLWVAWHLGTVRTWPIAPRVRARSFALVLAVSAVLATGGLAAAAAVHSVVPQRDDRNLLMAPSGSSVDQLGPTRNGQTGTDEPEQTDDADQSPASTDEPDTTEQTGGGSGIDWPSDADEGAPGGQPDEADDHEDHDSDDSDSPDDRDDSDDGADADDGSDDDDRPVATDDHDAGDDGDQPEEADDPDDPHDGSGGGDEHEEADDGGTAGGQEPDETDDGGSSGGDAEADEAPGSDGQESGG